MRRGNRSKPFAAAKSNGSCATALTAPHCLSGGKGKSQRHHASENGEKLISRPESLFRSKDRRNGEDVRESVWSGERAPHKFPLYSNLLHKSRDIGKRVSRFLCNEFAVRSEGKEGSKSRGEARLISPFTSGVFAKTAGRLRFARTLLVAKSYASLLRCVN